MATLAQLAEEYLAGPQTVRQAVAGLNREQLVARPVAGKWSTLEVVCHLADFEPILADRMKRVIAEERPSLIGANENSFAAKLAYSSRDLNEELGIIDNTRRQMSRILKTLAPEALTRIGVHNERGPLTLETLLTTAIRHIPHHVQFIMEKRRALGLSA
jgi:uncharacterized damage-inducible protein DinB